MYTYHLSNHRKTYESRPVFSNFFPKGTVPIFARKKVKHASDLIASLSINGPCTITKCVEFILTRSNEQESKNIRIQSYHNLIRDTRNHGQKYSGLISDGYLMKINKIGKAWNYTLTLKGCLVALGHNFDNKELENLISRMARNHLFFAYLNNILKKTSIVFVKEIFISPLQNMIKKGKITLDDDIRFCFSIIADVCASILYKKLNKTLGTYYRKWFKEEITGDIHQTYPGIMYVRDLIKNTFYHANPPVDWWDRIIEYFYPNEEDWNFLYANDCDIDLDRGLVYKVMREIHFTYYWALGFPLPEYTNRLPRSKELRLHYRRGKRNLVKKSPYFLPASSL